MAHRAGVASIKLFDFADPLSTMVAIADNNGLGLHFSPALRTYVGRSRQNLIDLAWLDTVHPREREATREAWHRALAQREGFTLETRVHHAPSGTYRWCALRLSRLPEDAPAARWWCEIEDVHAQRTARDQQAALAHLGRTALQGADLPDLMNSAVRLVVDTLGVELCRVLECRPGTSELFLRAGVGWGEGLIGSATEPAGPGTQAGRILETRDPVVVEDWRAEARSPTPALLREHEVLSSMGVTIDTPDGPYGVLGAHSRTMCSFTPEDTHFLQAVANILGKPYGSTARGRHCEQERGNCRPSPITRRP